MDTLFHPPSMPAAAAWLSPAMQLCQTQLVPGPAAQHTPEPHDGALVTLYKTAVVAHPFLIQEAYDWHAGMSVATAGRLSL